VGVFLVRSVVVMRVILLVQHDLKTSQLFTSVTPTYPHSNKPSSLSHLMSTVYILCTVCCTVVHIMYSVLYSWRFWSCYQQLCELPVQGVLKVTV
jgi:hypothetical protein